MDAFTTKVQNNQGRVASAAIMKGAEIQDALDKKCSGMGVILSELIVDLVEGKAGAKDKAIEMFKLGVVELPQESDEHLLFISYGLNKALKATSTHSQLKKIFLMWPTLRSVTERFCYYISPLLDGKGGISLLEESLVTATRAYKNEKRDDMKVQAYILGLTEQASQLTSVSISGKYSRGIVTWIPFSQPISDWMKKCRLKSLTMTKRPCTCDAKTAQAILLSHILTVDDLSLANLQIFVGTAYD